MPVPPASAPGCVRAEITGGDALGHGNQPSLSWWLPAGSSRQDAYRLRTDDGYDTGRVDSQDQSFVRLPILDRSRRSAGVQVKVWTDLGESGWSDPIRLESGLLAAHDWQAQWIGIDEDPRPGPGCRPAYWLRTRFELPPYQQARLYITALGLYEAFLDGQRVGDIELAPGYTQYRARVQYQAYDVTDLLGDGLPVPVRGDRRRRPRAASRPAAPVHRNRGGRPAVAGRLVELRRGAAPDRARLPDLRGAAATRRRHELRHGAPRQPVRPH